MTRSTTRMPWRPAALAAALAMAMVTAACGGASAGSSGTSSPTTASPTTSAPPTTTATPTPSESSSGDGGTITIGSDTANDHGTKDLAGKSSLDVELDDFYFEPTIITGTAGQKVTLELENEGAALHNFSLTDQSIDKDVQPGQKMDVTVTIPQSGTVEFFCKYHRTLGMVGGLSAS
jgi:plastocyanin